MPNFPTSLPRCFIYCADVEASGTSPAPGRKDTVHRWKRMATRWPVCAATTGLGKVWNWQLELLLFIGTMKGDWIVPRGGIRGSVELSLLGVCYVLFSHLQLFLLVSIGTLNMIFECLH